MRLVWVQFRSRKIFRLLHCTVGIGVNSIHTMCIDVYLVKALGVGGARFRDWRQEARLAYDNGYQVSLVNPSILEDQSI